MTVTITGIPALQRRLKAVDKVSGRPLLRTIQLDATANAKRRVHRRTGFLARSIKPGSLTDSYTIVEATAPYAAYEELGTRPHVIKPTRKKVLAWAASPGGARLSGSPRRGAKMAFARKVNHPGTKAHPYLVPGAQDAIRDNIGTEAIVRAWNSAA